MTSKKLLLSREFATGVSLTSHGYLASLTTGDGIAESVAAGELSKRGLPMPAVGARNFECEFGSFQPCDPLEYIRGMNVLVADGTDVQHTVWAYKLRQTRMLIPSLLLMRALFVPPAAMRHLFAPQSIDRVCHPVVRDGAVQVEVAPELGKLGRARSQTQAMRLQLAWLYSSPSGRQSFASVHENAMHGRIGLSLPQAKVRLFIKGVSSSRVCGQGERDFFVTRLSLHSVTPYDLPRSDKSHGTTIQLTDESHFDHRRDGCGASLAIPQRGDEVVTSDAEWERIAPLLPRSFFYKGDPRAGLDGILTKSITGVRWDDLPTPVRNRSTKTLKRLRNLGIWTRVAATLIEMRRSAEAAPAPYGRKLEQ